MGWLISDNEYNQLRHLLAWGGCGGSNGLVATVLDRAIPVKVEDLKVRPLRWVRNEEVKNEQEREREWEIEQADSNEDVDGGDGCAGRGGS
jgi:hypothetical protein